MKFFQIFIVLLPIIVINTGETIERQECDRIIERYREFVIQNLLTTKDKCLYYDLLQQQQQQQDIKTDEENGKKNTKKIFQRKIKKFLSLLILSQLNQIWNY